jgi:hypothetical protein
MPKKGSRVAKTPVTPRRPASVPMYQTGAVMGMVHYKDGLLTSIAEAHIATDVKGAAMRIEYNKLMDEMHAFMIDGQILETKIANLAGKTDEKSMLELAELNKQEKAMKPKRTLSWPLSCMSSSTTFSLSITGMGTECGR